MLRKADSIVKIEIEKKGNSMKTPKISGKKLSFILNIILALALITGFIWHQYIVSYQIRDNILMRGMIRASILAVLDSPKKPEDKIDFLKEHIANSLEYDSKVDCDFFEIKHIFQFISFLPDKQFKDTKKYILQILKAHENRSSSPNRKSPFSSNAPSGDFQPSGLGSLGAADDTKIGRE